MNDFFSFVSMTDEAKQIMEEWFNEMVERGCIPEYVRNDVFKKTNEGWDILFGKFSKGFLEDHRQSNESISDTLVRLHKAGQPIFH